MTSTSDQTQEEGREEKEAYLYIKDLLERNLFIPMADNEGEPNPILFGDEEADDYFIPVFDTREKCDAFLAEMNTDLTCEEMPAEVFFQRFNPDGKTGVCVNFDQENSTFLDNSLLEWVKEEFAFLTEEDPEEATLQVDPYTPVGKMKEIIDQVLRKFPEIERLYCTETKIIGTEEEKTMEGIILFPQFSASHAKKGAELAEEMNDFLEEETLKRGISLPVMADDWNDANQETRDLLEKEFSPYYVKTSS